MSAKQPCAIWLYSEFTTAGSGLLVGFLGAGRRRGDARSALDSREMTPTVRYAALAGAVLVASATVTYLVERNRGRKAALAAVAAAPAPSKPKRVTCDSLLAARNAAFRESFDVSPEDVYRGPPAQVVFAGRPDVYIFRSRIREAMARGVNFGGRYVVASWSCGQGCQQHAVLDAMNGAIVAFGLRTEAGLDYSLRSRLLITNPKKNVAAPDSSDLNPLEIALQYSRIPREYYEVVEGNATSALHRVCVENAFEGETF